MGIGSDDPINFARLEERLSALERALDDLGERLPAPTIKELTDLYSMRLLGAVELRKTVATLYPSFEPDPDVDKQIQDAASSIAAMEEVYAIEQARRVEIAKEKHERGG